MQQVQRRQRVFKLRHRLAGLDRIFAKPRQRSLAHRKHPRQFLRRIRSVVPQVRVRMRPAQRPCVLIGDIPQSILLVLAQNPIQRRRFIRSRSKLRVAILDCDLVPRPNPHRVRRGQIRLAIRANRHQRMRIIHHTHALPN